MVLSIQYILHTSIFRIFCCHSHCFLRLRQELRETGNPSTWAQKKNTSVIQRAGSKYVKPRVLDMNLGFQNKPCEFSSVCCLRYGKWWLYVWPIGEQHQLPCAPSFFIGLVRSLASTEAVAPKITSPRVIPTVTLYWNIFVTNSDILSALRSLDFIRIILSSSSLLLVRGPAVTTVIYQAKLIQTDSRYAWFKTISDARASPDA